MHSINSCDLNQRLPSTRIMVVGLGGVGCAAIAKLSVSGTLSDVTFLALDVDTDSLTHCAHVPHVHLADPKELEFSCTSDGEKDWLTTFEFLMDGGPEVLMPDGEPDLVFVVGGLGGGLGTKGLPQIAGWYRSREVLTVGVVTIPGGGEDQTNLFAASPPGYYSDMGGSSDTCICIPLKVVLALNPLRPDANIDAAYDLMHEVIRSVCCLVTQSRVNEVDFADVRTVFKGRLVGAFGVGSASGPNRAKLAAARATQSALLGDYCLQMAEAVLVCISASNQIALDEFEAVGDIISDVVTNKSTVVVGISSQPQLAEMLRVSILGVGFRHSDDDPVSEKRHNVRVLSKFIGQVDRNYFIQIDGVLVGGRFAPRECCGVWLEELNGQVLSRHPFVLKPVGGDCGKLGFDFDDPRIAGIALETTNLLEIDVVFGAHFTVSGANQMEWTYRIEKIDLQS